MTKTQTVLEFNKILEMLCDHTTNEISRGMAESLLPCDNFSEAESLQQELSAAINTVITKGNPQISGLHDITSALLRCEKGGILNTKELLNIAGVFKIARLLKFYYDESGVLDLYFTQLERDKKIEIEIYTAINKNANRFLQ